MMHIYSHVQTLRLSHLHKSCYFALIFLLTHTDSHEHVSLLLLSQNKRSNVMFLLCGLNLGPGLQFTVDLFIYYVFDAPSLSANDGGEE